MTTSLAIALLLTLLYVLLEVNKDIYRVVMNEIFRINYPLALTIGAWVFFIMLNLTNMTISIIITVIAMAAILLAMYAVHYSRKNNSKNEDPKEKEYSEKINEYYSSFIGRRGEVTMKLQGNYYYGISKNPISGMNETIMVYCDTELNQGDNFEITNIEGPNIVAKKA